MICGIYYKLDKLLGSIEDVKAHIYDILALSKEIFYNNIYHIIVIFDSMCVRGLKVNAPKKISGLKDNP